MVGSKYLEEWLAHSKMAIQSCWMCEFWNGPEETFNMHTHFVWAPMTEWSKISTRLLIKHSFIIISLEVWTVEIVLALGTLDFKCGLRLWHLALCDVNKILNLSDPLFSSSVNSSSPHLMSIKVVKIEKALRKQGIVTKWINYFLFLSYSEIQLFFFKFLAAKLYGLISKIRKNWLLKIEMAWLILIDIEYVNVIDKSLTEKQRSQLFSNLICKNL